MSQSADLIDAAKRLLKARGLTYHDVAAHLELSVPSVKRLFSRGTFSLQRLERLCQLLDVSLFDLARMARPEDTHASSVLSIEQEEALADDPALLAFFYLVLNGWSPDEISRRHHLDRRRRARLLRELNRLRLAESRPDGSLKCLTARRVAWRPRGPVRQAYERAVKALFLQDRFEGSEARLRFESADLSPNSVRVLLRKIERLCADFDELAELDIGAPRESKQGMGLLVALRPWTYWLVLEGGLSGPQGGPSYSQ